MLKQIKNKRIFILTLLICYMATSCISTKQNTKPYTVQDFPLKISFDKTFSQELIYEGLFLSKTGFYSEKPEVLFSENIMHFFNELLISQFKQSNLFKRVIITDKLRAEQEAGTPVATLYMKAFTNRIIIEPIGLGHKYRSEAYCAILLYKKGINDQSIPVYYRTYQIRKEHQGFSTHPSLFFAEDTTKLLERILIDIAQSDLDNPDYESLEETIIKL